MLTSLGRRNQSLLHRQLRIIDTLEQQASSPAALADLFALDHLTTRMRRHAESLTVLAGAPAPRPRSGPVPVIDVIRAAVAETEDYQRVSVRTESEDVVTAPAVNDMIHLLAELIENAALFSPSTTRVEVRAERVANGFAIEVEDRGLGIAPGQLGELNGRLASPPDFDVVDADRLGLFVAGRLAARHAVEVSLTPSPYRGTKAIVLLPDTLVLARADAGLAPAGGALDAGRDQSPEPFTLVGAAMARPLSADREDEELGVGGMRRRTGPRPPGTGCRAGSGPSTTARSGRPRPPAPLSRTAAGEPPHPRRPPRRTTPAGWRPRCRAAGSGARRKKRKKTTPRRPVSHGTPWNRPGQCSTRRRKSDGNRRGVGGARPRLVAR